MNTVLGEERFEYRHKLDAANYDKLLDFSQSLDVFDVDFFHNSMSLLHELFGFERMTLLSVDATGRWSKPIGFNVPDEANDVFDREQRYSNFFDSLYPATRQKVKNDTLLSTDFLPFDRIKNTEHYKKLLSRYDMHHVMLSYLRADHHLVGVLSIFRGADEYGFCESDIGIIERATPLLSKKFQEAKNVYYLRRNQTLLTQLTDDVDYGIIISDSAGTLMYANCKALQTASELYDCQSEREAAISVGELVGAISSNEQVLRTKGVSFVDIKGNKCFYEFIPIQLEGLNGKQETYNFIFLNRKKRAEDPMQMLPIMFDLTERESAVFKLMASGLNNREISQALNISYNTVRTHVEHIRKKANAKNKLEVLSGVNSFF